MVFSTKSAFTLHSDVWETLKNICDLTVLLHVSAVKVSGFIHGRLWTLFSERLVQVNRTTQDQKQSRDNFMNGVRALKVTESALNASGLYRVTSTWALLKEADRYTSYSKLPTQFSSDISRGKTKMFVDGIQILWLGLSVGLRFGTKLYECELLRLPPSFLLHLLWYTFRSVLPASRSLQRLPFTLPAFWEPPPPTPSAFHA